MEEQKTQTTDTGAVATPKPQTTTPGGARPFSPRPPMGGGFRGAPRPGGAGGAGGARPPFRRGGFSGGARRPVSGGVGAPGQQGAGSAGGARGGFRQGGRPGQGGGRPGGRFQERRPSEFEQKMIDIRRVTRVVAGGRRFSFSVALVAGDRNGRVGFGMGKATDTSLAIEKAFKDARKNMLTLRLTKTKSIRHDLSAKFGSASVTMMPNKGRGLIAGSSARVVLAFAGVKDVTAKYQSGTKNKINNAKAAIAALSQIAYKHGEAPVRKVELKVEGVE
ncbi:MAG: 30S ribosomal protein S5 [Minisyncoccia bacterium]